MKPASTSLILLLTLFFAGCATGTRYAGPVAAPEGKAIVYFYFLHGSLIPKPPQDLYINGEKVVRLPAGAFCLYRGNPGTLVISDEANPPAGAERQSALKQHRLLELSVQAGQVYYVERVYVVGFPKPSGSFLVRDDATATTAITDCIQVGTDALAADRPAAAPDRAPSPATPGPTGAPLTTPDRQHYDSLLTADAAVIADTPDEKGEVDGLISFLKEQKENRDFDQIARIEFSSRVMAKVGFTWFGGKHTGTLYLVKDAGSWKIISESHSI